MRKRYEVDVYTTGSETIDASPEDIQRAVMDGLPDYFVDVREKTDEVRATEWKVVLQSGSDIVKVVQAAGATDEKEFETALRNAVKEFTNTPEGKEYCEEICGDFNWADAFLHVPDDIWLKHGIYLKPERDAAQTLALPHDEILIDLDGWRKEHA